MKKKKWRSHFNSFWGAPNIYLAFSFFGSLGLH